MKKSKQLSYFDSATSTRLNANIVIVKTDDLDLRSQAGVDVCVERMFAVPLSKTILLDIFIGRKRGSFKDCPDSEAAMLYRIQTLLNHRHRGKRFDFLGNSLTARMFRESIRTEAWNPFKQADTFIPLEPK